MLNTQNYILEKYKIDLNQKSPFHINCDRLVDLPDLFRELGFTKGAEIGVLEGKFSEILCQKLPDAKIYSIDKWGFYPIRKNFRRQKQYDAFYIEARDRLAKYPNNEIIREWSMDALNKFEDESLDFVFIDANHEFQYVAQDIAAWRHKVKKGGIISGHDFGKPTNLKETFCHVYWVVIAWAQSHGIHPWFVLESPDAKERSWMWVKY